MLEQRMMDLESAANLAVCDLAMAVVALNTTTEILARDLKDRPIDCNGADTIYYGVSNLLQGVIDRLNDALASDNKADVEAVTVGGASYES